MLQLLQILIKLPRSIDGVFKVSVVHPFSIVLRQLPCRSECVSDLAAVHIILCQSLDIPFEIFDIAFNVLEPRGEVLPDCLTLLFVQVVIVQ
jgi:hypothetical protein